MEYTLGVDFGGTNIAAAFVDVKGEVHYKKEIKTLVANGLLGIIDNIVNLISAVIDEAGCEINENIQGLG